MTSREKPASKMMGGSSAMKKNSFCAPRSLPKYVSIANLGNCHLPSEKPPTKRLPKEVLPDGRKKDLMLSER